MMAARAALVNCVRNDFLASARFVLNLDGTLHWQLVYVVEHRLELRSGPNQIYSWHRILLRW
jgi:hypothetical protein